MMEFPSEILELIVLQGLDSCQTAVSWTHISQRFQSVVTGSLGVVVLQDGIQDLQDIDVSFDYKKLMSEFNTLFVCTDRPNATALLEFVKKYMHLLIIVQSNRNYSDVLASLMTKIAKDCCRGTTISVIYNSLQNYLSKLYFRGMSLSEGNVLFSELHIVGISSLNVNQLFDIDTLFERTVLNHISEIYSLNVQNKAHRLISEDLTAINQLNFATFDEEWYDYFIECPNLSKIENTKYPMRTTDVPFILPKCDFISLTHYVDGTHYQPMDGSQISTELKIVPTLKSINPEFYNLHFPNLKTLKLVFSDSESHLVRLHHCHFNSLGSLDCGSCLVPWSDLMGSGASLKHIKLSLSTDEQAKWLCQCPYQLDKVSITSNGVLSPVLPNISHLPVKLMSCKAVDLDIQSIWHCYLYQALVLPNVGLDTHLTISLKETSLQQSILENNVPIEKWGISFENDCMILGVPSLEHFILSVTDSIRSSKRNNGVSKAFPNTRIDSYTSDYPNIFFDDYASHQNYAVSPSAFRRNSLTGVDSATARRQSEIPNLTSHTAYTSPLINGKNSLGCSHLMNDDSSFTKTCKFVFIQNCPKTFTVNLSTLDSSFISWEKVKGNRITLLEILVQDLHLEVRMLKDLIYLLSEEIIRALKFPYHESLRGIIVETLRVIIDLGSSGINIKFSQRNQFAADLQQYLTLRGHNLKVLTRPAENCLVSVLLNF